MLSSTPGPRDLHFARNSLRDPLASDARRTGGFSVCVVGVRVRRSPGKRQKWSERMLMQGHAHQRERFPRYSRV